MASTLHEDASRDPRVRPKTAEKEAALTMAKDTATSPQHIAGEWHKPESFSSAVTQIAVVAVVLAGGLLFYYNRVQTGRRALEASKAGKEELLKDDPKAFVIAAAKLSQALDQRSDYPYALAFLAELNALRFADHGLPGAAEEADKWVARADKEAVPYQERYAAKGLLMVARGQNAEAEKLLAGILQKGNGAHLWNTLARAERAQGKLDEARAHFKKGNDMEWRNPRLADDYADIFFESGDMANAINYYAKGIEANSEHLRSLLGRSRVQIARGMMVKEATDTVTDILGRPETDLSPRLRAMALTARAELRRLEQKDDEALKDADAAIAAQSTYPWPHHVKGMVLARGKRDGAYDALQKAVELDRNVPIFYFDGANALADAGVADKATALMAAYTRALPETDGYHIVFGDVLRKVNRLDEALVHYDKAIQLNGLNATARFAKGRLLLMKKDYDNAKKELDAAVTSNEYFGEAYEALGLLHMEKKEYADAAEKYFQALTIYAQLQVSRERLNALLDDVAAKLKKAGKREIAEAWTKEGKGIIR